MAGETIPAVGLADIEAAAARIAPHAVKTPLLESELINDRLGARVLFKPECLQRTGSFKFRGACNKLAALPEADRARGVVAFSSGNHAQGVAAAARLFGVPAVIVMPADAPAIKIRNTRAHGAEVVLYDRHREDRTTIARDISERRNLTVVPPFDDVHIIAGQGTAGLEMIEQARALGVVPGLVLSPCGGGGLVAGLSTAVKALSPQTEIWAVEPEAFDDTRRSFAAGNRLANPLGRSSICDALLSDMPGAITFAINRSTLSGVLAVSDAQAQMAMAEAMLSLKLVVEPGGAVAFAAILSGAVDIRGKVAMVMLSGGNVDPETFRAALAAAA